MTLGAVAMVNKLMINNIEEHLSENEESSNDYVVTIETVGVFRQY